MLIKQKVSKLYVRTAYFEVLSVTVTQLNTESQRYVKDIILSDT